MSKFTVMVEITSIKEKELTIYANNVDEAKEKAEELVLEWDGVDNVEIKDVEYE